MSSSHSKVKSVLLRHLLKIVDYMMEHDCTPESREQYINDSIADLVSELRPFLDLPLLWKPMSDLKGVARTILTAAPDALTRCHHFDPNAVKIKRPGFQPTHFCEVPPGAPNAGYMPVPDLLAGPRGTDRSPDCIGANGPAEPK